MTSPTKAALRVILGLCLSIASCAPLPAPLPKEAPALPSAVEVAYKQFVNRMNTRIASLTAPEVQARWGPPDSRSRDGNLACGVWNQGKRPFPLLPAQPERGTIERELYNLRAAQGDGFEWPLTFGLHMCFSEVTDRLERWRLAVQDGSIYTPHR